MRTPLLTGRTRTRPPAAAHLVPCPEGGWNSRQAAVHPGAQGFRSISPSSFRTEGEAHSCSPGPIYLKGLACPESPGSRGGGTKLGLLLRVSSPLPRPHTPALLRKAPERFTQPASLATSYKALQASALKRVWKAQAEGKGLRGSWWHFRPGGPGLGINLGTRACSAIMLAPRLPVRERQASWLQLPGTRHRLATWTAPVLHLHTLSLPLAAQASFSQSAPRTLSPSDTLEGQPGSRRWGCGTLSRQKHESNCHSGLHRALTRGQGWDTLPAIPSSA